MNATVGDTLAQRYILHHEFMHTLGFLGHVSLPQFSSVMFAQPLLPYLSRYTPFDKKMMLLLYNPAIQPSMTESVFNSTFTNL